MTTKRWREEERSRREVFREIMRARKAKTPDARRAIRQEYRDRFLARLEPSTRRVIEFGEEEARNAGASLLDTGHLLAGVVRADVGPSGEVLREADVSVDVVRPRLRGDFSDADAAALAALGISLDEVTERTRAAFGPDALSRPRS